MFLLNVSLKIKIHAILKIHCVSSLNDVIEFTLVFVKHRMIFAVDHVFVYLARNCKHAFKLYN